MAVPKCICSFLWPEPRAHKTSCSWSLNLISQLTENQVFLGFCFAQIPRFHFSFPAPLLALRKAFRRTVSYAVIQKTGSGQAVEGWGEKSYPA